MTDAQKYTFDLKGWICLPGLFHEEQLDRIRQHQMDFLYRREALPPEERDNHGGPSQALLDHPAVVGVLNEILSHRPLATEDCYGFRYDHTYTSHRKAGNDNFGPHGGGAYFSFCRQFPHLPDAAGAGPFGPDPRGVGTQRSGRRRRGNDVPHGSHKAAFPRPEEVSGRESSLWETYTCPAGSAVIFTEALCHTGTRWTNETRDRLTLFTCYNTVNAKWGKGCPPPEVIAALPPKRQTLFRGVWHGMREVPGINQYYEQTNRAV